MIFNAPNTKKNRIAAYIAIALGLGVGLFLSLSDNDNADPVAEPNVPETVMVEDMEFPTPPEAPEIRNVTDIDFGSYSLDLAKFVDLEVGETKEASSQKIKAYFAPEKGAEGNAAYEFTEFGAIGGYVMLASSDGIADDSIKGQALYAIFKDEKLVTYGMKIKCWRGDNKDNWQTEYCP